MPRAIELLGQTQILRDVRGLIAEGRSVLLVGPEAVGKSAIVRAVSTAEIAVLDPLQHLGTARAHQIRRALDRGVVHLAACRSTERRELGPVGRILWRFSIVRVRELPDAVLRRIIAREAGHIADEAWVGEIAALAHGRPGFAVAMTRFSLEWRRRYGYLPLPPLAFAASREDSAIHALGGSEMRPRARHAAPRT